MERVEEFRIGKRDAVWREECGGVDHLGGGLWDEVDGMRREEMEAMVEDETKERIVMGGKIRRG